MRASLVFFKNTDARDSRGDLFSFACFFNSDDGDFTTLFMMDTVVVAKRVAGARGLFSRFFSFTRVNPKGKEYPMLVRTCERIDACVAYVTIKDGGDRRLTGFLVLRGPRTYADKLMPLFPNFLIKAVKSANYFDVPAGYVWRGDLPFQDIKRRLFDREGREVGQITNE